MLQMDLSAKLAVVEVSQSIPKILCREILTPAKITAARKVQTRFNHPVVLLEVITAAGDQRVTFLPTRFTNTLSDADCEHLTISKEYSVVCTNSGNRSPDIKNF